MPPGRRRFVSIMRSESLPLSALAVSAAGHLFVVGGLVLLANLWMERDRSKVYVVNLVPAVPSLGRPAPEAPLLPARSVQPKPQAQAQAQPQPQPQPRPRETEPAARERQEDARPEPSMPSRAAPATVPTAPALPRAGEKELPSLASPSLPERRPLPTPLPPTPIGRPTGSPVVAPNSAISLDVSDFPFAWYLRQMVKKVEERWNSQPPLTQPERIPVVKVEILRNGTIKPPTIEKSSGNSVYDRAALRAVQEASPFPPLPEEWSKPSLRVGLGFELSKERG